MNRKQNSYRVVNQLRISHLRTGYTAVTGIQSFQDGLNSFLSDLDSEIKQQEFDETPDISVSDLVVPTPFAAIESSIAKEMEQVAERKEGKAPATSRRKAISPQELNPNFGQSMPVMERMIEALAPLRAKKRRDPRNPNSLSPEHIARLTEERLASSPQRTLLTDQDSHVVLRVSVYHSRSAVKLQEWLVLAQQPLTALRDVIDCPAQRQLASSTCSPDDQAIAARPSGCFFAENVFYDDTRDPEALRYSQTIIDWVEEGKGKRHQHPGLDHYAALNMQDVRFSDLALRLGSHYLYQHMGDCCHTWIVTEMRGLRPGVDPVCLEAYPQLVFKARARRRPCEVCQALPAKWVTYDDELAPTEPFYCCGQCFSAMHLDGNGQPLYSFKAFKRED